MNKKEKINFLKWYLGEFYTPSINIDIWKKTKKISVLNNLIIYSDRSNIKYIMHSLIRQKTIELRKPIEFFTTQLYRILEVVFNDIEKNEEDFRITYSKLIQPSILIIKEYGDPNHSYYKNILSTVISERMLNEKNTILIFTTKNCKDILPEDLYNEFKIINFEGKIIESNKKNNVNKNIKHVNNFDEPTPKDLIY